MLLKEIREKDVMDRLNEAKSIKRKQDEIKSKQAIERLAKAREDVETKPSFSKLHSYV